MIAKFIEINWNNNLPVYSSANYLSTISDEFGWIGGFEKEKLLFILPYVIYRKLIFCYAQFQSGTIFIEPHLNNDQEKVFLEQVLLLLKTKVDFIIQPPTHALFQSAPSGTKYIDYGTYLIDLQKSEEEIWGGMHSKHRGKIRKAELQNVTVKSGIQFLDGAHELLVKTMGRSGMAFMGKEEFEILVNSLGPNITIYVAFHEDQIQGCVIVFHTKYGAYIDYAGSVEKPILGAMNYLHWWAMKDLKKNGVRLYDFVGARLNPPPGSKLEGIQQFKRQFGTTLKKGYLWKCAFSNWKYKLYAQLLKIKNRGGTIDIIDEEFDEKHREMVPFVQGHCMQRGI